MLSKPFRLRSRSDFDRLWKQGRAFYGRILGIRWAPNRFVNARFGILLGVKLHKRAVRRNLARRRLREALRREFIPAIKGVDVAIIGRPGIIEAPYSKIIEELRRLFERARLL